MRESISNTAKYGDYTRGPRIVNDETKATMKDDAAKRFQSGDFAQAVGRRTRRRQAELQELQGRTRKNTRSKRSASSSASSCRGSKPTKPRPRQDDDGASAAASRPSNPVQCELGPGAPRYAWGARSPGRSAFKMIPAITPRPRTGGDAVLEALEREGVDVIFGYPGGTIMPFYDALYGHPMRHILVRHEAGAAFAAGGYARTSGRVGVCCATSGPGATNLVTGLVDAMMDSIPVVAITGQRAHGELMGTDGFQEADVCAITQCATKASILDHRSGSALHQSARSVRARAQRPAGPRAGRHPDRRAESALRAGAASAAQGERRQAGCDRQGIDQGGGRCDSQFTSSGGDRRRRRARTESGQGVPRTVTALLGLPHTTTICGLGASDPNDVRTASACSACTARKRPTSPCIRPTSCWRSACGSTTASPASPDRFAKGATVVHNDIDVSEFNKIIPTERDRCTAIPPTRSKR